LSHESSSALQATPLLTGLVIGESPRWHEERLWFANWGTEEIVAVALEGDAEVVGEGPPGLGWSIDWLPDGRLLVYGPSAHAQGARRFAGGACRPERLRR
jgi:sugar lactone lactonase YvrE